MKQPSRLFSAAVSPGRSSISSLMWRLWGSSNDPSRTLGPGRSAMTPIGRPTASAMRRSWPSRSMWSSRTPWDRFNRATSIPASTMALMVDSSEHAGPIVAMIFVRRFTYCMLLRCLFDDSGCRPTLTNR